MLNLENCTKAGRRAGIDDRGNRADRIDEAMLLAHDIFLVYISADLV